MSNKQKANATAGALASRYTKIAAIYDSLPDRFKLLEAMRAAGIRDSPASRCLVGAVLYQDFKCVCVGRKPLDRRWKKPGKSV